MVDVNFLAIFLSVVAAIVVGSLWYGPLFGKPWMKEMGKDPKKWESKAFKENEMWKLYVLQMLGSVVMAYVLAHSLAFGNAYMGISGISAGLQGAFWNWLGFGVPVSLGSVLWDGKSWKLFAINAGNYLVTLLAMGVVLSVWV